MKFFKTTVLGVGPFCVEFDDGEIVTTRDESRQRLIGAAPDMLTALKLVMKLMEDGKLVRDIASDARPDWAMEAMGLVRDLQTVQTAIFKAEGYQAEAIRLGRGRA